MAKSQTLRVLKVHQPIGEFYIGAIDSTNLLEIATVDVREFAAGNPGKIDGIQRELSTNRLRELREYVNLEYSTFPTSIIIAIDERCVNLEPIEGCRGLYQLVVSGYEGSEDESPIPVEKSAFILDGQHRLAGLENRDPKKPPFEVNVSIFVGADIADQAEIFSRVNLAQTKVNKSLMYDLLEYAREQSPYKTAHDVTVALNMDEYGPFYKKIKRLGVRTPDVDTETLAQATVVNGLLRHLPKGQDFERNKSIFGFTKKPEPGETWKNRIFTEFYRSEDTLSILKVTSNYFEAVRDRWPISWNYPEEGRILCRTTGYNALIRFMKDAFLSLTDRPRVIKKEEFSEIFSRIKIPESQLTKEIFIPGSTGASDLYRRLMKEAFED